MIELEDDQLDLIVRLCGKTLPKTWEDRTKRVLDLLEDRQHKIDKDGYGPIWISKTTRIRLKEFAKKGEFWDDLLWRLSEIIKRPLDLSDVLPGELIAQIDEERIEPMLSREEFIKLKLNETPESIPKNAGPLQDIEQKTIPEQINNPPKETPIDENKLEKTISKEQDLISMVEKFKRGR